MLNINNWIVISAYTDAPLGANAYPSFPALMLTLVLIWVNSAVERKNLTLKIFPLGSYADNIRQTAKKNFVLKYIKHSGIGLTLKHLVELFGKL